MTESSLTVCFFSIKDKPTKVKNSKIFKFRLNGLNTQIMVFKEILAKEDVTDKTGVLPSEVIKLPNFQFSQDEIFLIPKFTVINGNKFLTAFGETNYINGICCISPKSEYASAALSVVRTIEGMKFLRLYPTKNVRFANISVNKFGKRCKINRTGQFYTYFFDDQDVAGEFDQMNFETVNDTELTISHFFRAPGFILNCSKQTARSLGIKNLLRVGNCYLIPPNEDLGKNKAFPASDITLNTSSLPQTMPTEIIRPIFEYYGEVLFITSSRAGHSITFAYAEGFLKAVELFGQKVDHTLGSPLTELNRPPKLSSPLSNQLKLGDAGPQKGIPFTFGGPGINFEAKNGLSENNLMENNGLNENGNGFGFQPFKNDSPNMLGNNQIPFRPSNDEGPKMIPLGQASTKSGDLPIQKLPLNETPFGMQQPGTFGLQGQQGPPHQLNQFSLENNDSIGSPGFNQNIPLGAMNKNKNVPFGMAQNEGPFGSSGSFGQGLNFQAQKTPFGMAQNEGPFGSQKNMGNNGFEPIPFGMQQNQANGIGPFGQSQNSMENNSGPFSLQQQHQFQNNSGPFGQNQKKTIPLSPEPDQEEQNNENNEEQHTKPNPFKIKTIPFADELPPENADQEQPNGEQSNNQQQQQPGMQAGQFSPRPNQFSPRPEDDDDGPIKFSPRPGHEKPDEPYSPRPGDGHENGPFRISPRTGQPIPIVPGEYSPRPDESGPIKISPRTGQEIIPGQYSPRPELEPGQYSPRPGENGDGFVINQLPGQGIDQKPQPFGGKANKMGFGGNNSKENFGPFGGGIGPFGSSPHGNDFGRPIPINGPNQMGFGAQGNNGGFGMGFEGPFGGNQGGFGLNRGGMMNDSPFGRSPFMDETSFSSSPFGMRDEFGFNSPQKSPFGFEGGAFGGGPKTHEPTPIQMHQPKLATIPSLSPALPGDRPFSGAGSVPRIQIGNFNDGSNQLVIANLIGNVTPATIRTMFDVTDVKYVDELEPLCSKNSIAYVIGTFGVIVPELENKIISTPSIFNGGRCIVKEVGQSLDDVVDEIISEWQSVKYVIANLRPEFNVTQMKLLLRHAKSVVEDPGLGTLNSTETKAFLVTFNGLENNYNDEIMNLSDKIFCGQKYFEIVSGKLESTVNAILKLIFQAEQKRVSRWVIGGLKQEVSALEVKVNLKNAEAVIPSVLLQPLCQPPNVAYLVYISAKSVDAASDIAALPLFNNKPLFAEIQRGNIQAAIESLSRGEVSSPRRGNGKANSDDEREEADDEAEDVHYIKFLLANLPPECTNEYLKKRLPSVAKITTDPALEKLNRGIRHAVIANFTSKDCKNEVKEFCKGKYGKMHPKVTLVKDNVEEAVGKILDYKTNARGNWLTFPLEKIHITKSDTYKDREAAVLSLAPDIVPQYIIIHPKNVYVDYNSEEKCKRAAAIING